MVVGIKPIQHAWSERRTDKISQMLHYAENIFNTYYCEIRFIVFHFNAGRYHVRFYFSSKTRVSHFRKSLETA